MFLLIVSFFAMLIAQIYLVFGVFSGKRDIEQTGENLFLSFAAAIIAVVLSAAALAIIGVYSFGLLNICMFLETVILFCAVFFGKKILPVRETFRLLTKHHYGKRILVVVLLASILYFAFPMEYMMGGRDPGLYFVDGVHIAKTGSMQFETDSYLNENYAEQKGFIKMGYPGLYSALAGNISDEPGKIVAQFLPMFPAALAVGYDIGGVDGLESVNNILAVVSLLAIFFFVKRNIGTNQAVIAAILMVVNPSQIWNARITQTEILAQFLFFMAVYVAAEAWKKNSWRLAALGGVLIGVGLFNRIDVYIFGLGVYILLAYCAACRPDRLLPTAVAAGIYTILGALALAYGFTFSQPYYDDLYNSGSLKRIVYINLGFAVLALLLILLRVLILKKKQIPDILQKLFLSKKLMIIFTVLLMMLFVFAYFIRPAISMSVPGKKDFFNSNAMVEFCFYTSFAAIPFAIIGTYDVLRNKRINPEPVFLFLLIGYASIIGYIYRPSISVDHIWASRRWISVCIPAVVILCSAGIWKCRELIPRYFKEFSQKRISVIQTASVIVCVGYLAGFGLMQSKPFLFEKIMANSEEQYISAAKTLDSEHIYYTNNTQVASIFRYVYDKNVYMCNSITSVSALSYLAKAKEIYFIGDLENTFLYGYKVEKLAQNTMTGKYLERTPRVFPQKLFVWDNTLNVYRITYDAGSNTSRNIDMNLFALDRSTREEGVITSSGEAGFVFYGANFTIPKGDYRTTIEAQLISSKTDDLGQFDITGSLGKKKIASVQIHKSDFDNDGKCTFTMDSKFAQAAEGTEIRFSVNTGVLIKITSVTVSKIA